MPINTQDFHNSLASLNLSPMMCLGFEEDAYGAVLGLLHFRELSLSNRHAWDTAVARAAAERNPASGFRSSASVFYGMLRQTRQTTFGNGLDNASIQASERLVAAPWCLSEAEFQYCLVYVRDGASPVLKDYDHSLLSEDQEFWAPWVFSVGQTALTQFLKRYTPEMIAAVEVTLERLSLPLLIASGIKTALDYVLAKITKAQMLQRYEIDARRRDYLRGSKRDGGGYVASAGAR
ncbi:hypothetical protein [Nitrospirillum sp. BR 11828]|uniref:hypothetical protein n=1 Tax=Nitrospirillum sp. BR 11828 TaxID=3104325 RepID=UPI002ACA6046|nr:hypothetical protein [Nitrospirillum sp. BR 11828]MDZ5647160.1 hypothetical protein [Nitrospirillum sp. BR 11828]